MITLLCNALWLAIVGLFGFVAVSVLLHEFVGVHAYVVICPDCDGPWRDPDYEGCDTCGGTGELDDEEFPEDPDRARDWAVADAMEAW